MKLGSNFVEGGGWTTCRASGRPKAQWCGLLSLLWLGVSLLSWSRFSDGWPYVFEYMDWLCIALVLPLPVFVILAVFYFFTEKPRAFMRSCRDPDYDLRNLY